MIARAYFTHIDDVTPENMNKGEGWFITEFRLPFSAREGLGTTMFHARFMPGAIHKKHRHENCEEIYYIVSGGGVAGAGGATEEVRAGHFHYVPADTEHWLINRDPDQPIEVVGWYLGAGSVADRANLAAAGASTAVAAAVVAVIAVQGALEVGNLLVGCRERAFFRQRLQD